MNYPIPVCLQLNITYGDPVSYAGTFNGNNLIIANFNLLIVQTYNYNNGPNYYDVSSISLGNWIAGSEGGMAWRIQSISNVNPYVSPQTITLTLEDVGNYCSYIDSLGTGGYPTSGSNYIYFTVSSDGLPIFSPLYQTYQDQLFPGLI